MNGDWDPECCDGPWNTGHQFRLTRGVTTSFDAFHYAIEWIFNHTLEKTWLTIPRYANHGSGGQPLPAGAITPLDVADRLEADAVAARHAITFATHMLRRGEQEFECTRLDVEAVSYLGSYYAEKIRGAPRLMLFLRGGQADHHCLSIGHLEQAAEWWTKLTAVVTRHYCHRGDWRPHNWERHLDDVRHDIELAKQMGYVEPKIW